MMIKLLVNIFTFFYYLVLRKVKKEAIKMNGIIPEMEQIISQLERGTLVTKFFPRKRPEKKTLMIRRETRQIVWARSTTSRPFDGSCNN